MPSAQRACLSPPSPRAGQISEVQVPQKLPDLPSPVQQPLLNPTHHAPCILPGARRLALASVFSRYRGRVGGSRLCLQEGLTAEGEEAVGRPGHKA